MRELSTDRLDTLFLPYAMNTRKENVQAIPKNGSAIIMAFKIMSLGALKLQSVTSEISFFCNFLTHSVCMRVT